MERLKPIDLERTQLRRRFRGFDRDQVQHLIGQAANEIALLLHELGETRTDLELLRREVEGYRLQESALTEALVLAQRTADETRSLAHRDAEAIVDEARRRAEVIRRDAEAECEDVMRELERLRAEKSRFIRELRANLQAHLDGLEDRQPVIVTMPKAESA